MFSSAICGGDETDIVDSQAVPRVTLDSGLHG